MKHIRLKGIHYINILLFISLVIFSCQRKDNSLRYEIAGELHKPPKGTHEKIQYKSIKLIDSIFGENLYRNEKEWNNSYLEDVVYYEIKYELDSITGKNIYIKYNLDLNLIEWDTVYYVE